MPEKLKLADFEFENACGLAVIINTGALVSTVHEATTLWLVLLALSVARIIKVCAPGEILVKFIGLVHIE